MENTRVFVSGLPPTFSNEQLRKHFASRYQVTDAHVLSKRRIGFVGFKSPEVAQQAANYFNRTYVKMSKISVEIARPVDSTPVGGSDDKNTSQGNSLKRKRDGKNAEADPKLQEYLSVMQHSSKTKTWANEEQLPRALPQKDSAVGAEPMEVDSTPAVSNDTQRKKAKVEVPDASQRSSTVPAREPRHEESKTENVDRVEVVDQSDDVMVQDESAAAKASEEPITDSDWLRSKTSRLLGLLDDEEQAEFGSAAQNQVSAPAEVRPETQSDDEPLAEQKKDTMVDDEAKSQPVVDTNVENILISARLFVRNLSYDASEADLLPVFEPFGKIEEIHVAFDTRSTTSKGFAYIQYVEPESAVNAYKSLDGKNFQGRLLHVLPAAAKKSYKIDEHQLAQLPLKKQKQIKRKMEATSSTFNWNALYMNTDAVMSSVAERLGVSKADLLDPTSSDAAVKQAHAETHVIQETKAYFVSNGVNIDAFKQRERGNTAILVKNFSYGVKSTDLRNLFEPYGQISRLLMPPSGTIAIVEFSRPDEAQQAFRGLAYRKLGDSILFLEKAPKDLFDANLSTQQPVPEVKAISQGFSTADTFTAGEADGGVLTSTLFVKNLDFSTTNEKFVDTFRPLDGFVSAKVKTKPDPKRPGQTLSMGFGFVDFRTKAQAQAAQAAMDGYRLDGHALVIKTSHKGLDAAEERRREDNAKKLAARRTKIIIKNLPFQATKKDVRSLFGAYGQLRSVRVPKKFDHSARGFAFADFISAREAENAMDALKNTHLLGRRLVLEFVNEEDVDPESEIAKIEKKVGEQMDRVKLQKLTGGGRKKFTVGAQDDGEA
ncbi:hypothetical protein ASPZODRAFT_151243 [Penicilliopsis zonata CBS 506.65]|uniref:Multiple RNA-binding domain-containing protein 1 n=1 Tax=Penicilliopsis zonata CBS 506.65 TaxID=1073090 RepID=A0A1L9SKP7_9EURO|nr:hypothetical protein ASPZODRAFT_151243 [Penicilliopsis zonata CBS 506.65]OJJ47802.1 hypothetical protein ASPZODRAFT_151243 [Penicilliopsis zonata CBS 506.65]